MAVGLRPVAGVGPALGGHESVQSSLEVKRRLGESGQLMGGERGLAGDMNVRRATVGSDRNCDGAENGEYLGQVSHEDGQGGGGMDGGDQLNAVLILPVSLQESVAAEEKCITKK